MFPKNNINRDPRNRLLEYLDQHAFQPVRNTFPDRYRESLMLKVAEVQNAVMALRRRYMELPDSAQDVIRQFEADLQSSYYQELSKDLDQLNLPTFYSVQNDFKRLIGELEIA